MDTSTARRRAALFALFFIPGIEIASWATRTPAIRDLLGASTTEMGLILLGLSAGSMTAVLWSGMLVARFGTRPVAGAGAFAVVLGIPVAGLGALAGYGVLVAAGLFLLGLGVGSGEVAINVEGADVERVIGRPVLPALHGFYSLGNVFGAALGLLLTAVGLPVVWHLVAVGALCAPVAFLSVRQLPRGVGLAPRGRSTPGHKSAAVWRDRRLLLIGLVVLGLALAEGSANDWLPLIMVDGHGLGPAMSSAVYLLFAASMTGGRFAGGRIIARFGRAPVLCAGAILGGVGLTLVIVSSSDVIASAAVLLWGLGAALGFPVSLSVAGDSGPNPAARVSFVAAIGYVAFLAGPPVLGFLGDRYGLRGAMVVVLVFLAVSAVFTPALGGRRSADDSSGDHEAVEVRN
ncbi:MFS transporter [Paractinoplanes globisporus]|uniref:MFS transporter n=1 Tax=Paractinoplanes globisporus TaxID=113565 RepID=A0ABW6WMI8_9ACTN|nr:MFS transporter [Actinoplanes globisporus]